KKGVPFASSDELKQYLEHKLPAYMMPKAWVSLESIPLTANGKVDRKKLLALKAEPDVVAHADHVVPNAGIEQALGELWAQILGVRQIGRQDNFFALGGHSLLAIRLVSRIRDRLRRHVRVRAVFEHPTLSALATHVKGLPADAASPLSARQHTDSSPLTRAQQTLWFFHQLEPDSAFYNLPWALRLRGELNEAALRWSLSALQIRHEALRTRYIEVDGRPRQVVDEFNISLEWHRFDDVPSEVRWSAVKTAVDDAAGQPFDLAAGPVFRCHLFQLAEDDHVLLLTLHHIAGDGGSVGVLVRELEMDYRRFLAGDREVGERALSCVDYAEWEDAQSDDRFAAELDYWRDRLQGAPRYLDLPG
ncbi:MAG: condensation domain-containing protein, partial [Myxococcota bacterium]